MAGWSSQNKRKKLYYPKLYYPDSLIPFHAKVNAEQLQFQIKSLDLNSLDLSADTLLHRLSYTCFHSDQRPPASCSWWRTGPCIQALCQYKFICTLVLEVWRICSSCVTKMSSLLPIQHWFKSNENKFACNTATKLSDCLHVMHRQDVLGQIPITSLATTKNSSHHKIEMTDTTDWIWWHHWVFGKSKL